MCLTRHSGQGRFYPEGVDGFPNFETDTKNHTATVWFDDEKTDVSAIEKALADGGFPAEGEVQFLK